MNSKNKGKRGERAWRDLLRQAGFLKAYRTQQYSGAGPDASDVNAPELPSLHFEVKNTERLNIREAFFQASTDACHQDKTPVVCYKSNRNPWLVILSAEDFLRILAHSDLVT
jgi:Holliday junction resolvase